MQNRHGQKGKTHKKKKYANCEDRNCCLLHEEILLNAKINKREDEFVLLFGLHHARALLAETPHDLEHVDRYIVGIHFGFAGLNVIHDLVNRNEGPGPTNAGTAVDDQWDILVSPTIALRTIRLHEAVEGGEFIRHPEIRPADVVQVRDNEALAFAATATSSSRRSLGWRGRG